MNMPPVHEDKKYCVRTSCPFPGNETVETFLDGVRQNMPIMNRFGRIEYTAILNSNGYQCVPVEDTTNFERG